MKKLSVIVGGVILLIGLLWYAAFSFSNNLNSGGGSQQYAPDTVQSGEPAEITLIVTATGGGGNIKGRFNNISLHYKLANETEYGVIQPKSIALPDNFKTVQSKTFQSEAYAFTIPSYPIGITGEIEYYIELTFDGNQSRQDGVKKIKIATTATSTLSQLGTPNAIIAIDYVALLLPMRECDKPYIIERSYNQFDWQVVGTTTFSTYKEPYDHNFRSCENNYIDSRVATGTKKLWYRYGLLDEKGRVTMWSNIGEVTMEDY